MLLSASVKIECRPVERITAWREDLISRDRGIVGVQTISVPFLGAPLDLGRQSQDSWKFVHEVSFRVFGDDEVKQKVNCDAAVCLEPSPEEDIHVTYMTKYIPVIGMSMMHAAFTVGSMIVE